MLYLLIKYEIMVFGFDDTVTSYNFKLYLR